MKINKVISRFASDSCDPVELRRVARALGNELRHNRVELLREFRTQLACVPIGPDVEVETDEISYATGYVAGLTDVSAEYETAIAPEAELSDDVARGIQLAVALFRQLVSSPYSSDMTLREVAEEILGDPMQAAEAVALWNDESQASGLVDNVAAAHRPGIPARADIAHVQTLEVPPVIVPQSMNWEQQPEHAGARRPSVLRAMTETLYEEDSEPSRPIPITQ